MMKFIHKLTIVLALGGICGLAACSDDDQGFLKRNLREMSFPYVESSDTFTIRATGDWQISDTPDSREWTNAYGWVHVDQLSGKGDPGTYQKVTVTCDQNTSEERNATIYLHGCGEENVAIAIRQDNGIFEWKPFDNGQRYARRRKLVRWTLGAAAAVLLAVCAGTAWHFLSTPDIYRVYENTGDAVTTVTLDDGTHVWLNARTKLTLPEAFGPTQRNVQLAGAAFFEVARDEAAPFVVSTDKLRVRVLGTSFCMQAYEGSQQAEVVLEHGSVRLQTPAGVNLVTLQPDQRALYDAADDNLAITQVNASHLVLTQYDLVTMSDATLHEIISHIETTFGVRLSVAGRYDDKRYTFNYQRSNSLEEVLNIVEYLTGEHCEVIYRKK